MKKIVFILLFSFSVFSLQAKTEKNMIIKNSQSLIENVNNGINSHETNEKKDIIVEVTICNETTSTFYWTDYSGVEHEDTITKITCTTYIIII